MKVCMTETNAITTANHNMDKCYEDPIKKTK